MPVKYSNKTTSFRHRMAKFKLRKISYKKAIKIIAKNCHLHENIKNSEVFSGKITYMKLFESLKFFEVCF